MTTVWIYIERDRKTQDIIDLEAFGSLRKMVEEKEIYIKGFKLPESSLRRVTKEGGDSYEDDVYIIRKMTLKTKSKS